MSCRYSGSPCPKRFSTTITATTPTAAASRPASPKPTRSRPAQLRRRLGGLGCSDFSPEVRRNSAASLGSTESGTHSSQSVERSLDLRSALNPLDGGYAAEQDELAGPQDAAAGRAVRRQPRQRLERVPEDVAPASDGARLPVDAHLACEFSQFELRRKLPGCSQDRGSVEKVVSDQGRGCPRLARST